MSETNGRDLFGAGVRILGLLAIARGFGDLIFVSVVLSGLSTPSSVGSFISDCVLGLFYLIGGLFLLRFAPLLVRFSYPKENDNSEVEERLRLPEN